MSDRWLYTVQWMLIAVLAIVFLFDGVAMFGRVISFAVTVACGVTVIGIGAWRHWGKKAPP